MQAEGSARQLGCSRRRAPVSCCCSLGMTSGALRYHGRDSIQCVQECAPDRSPGENFGKEHSNSQQVIWWGVDRRANADALSSSKFCPQQRTCICGVLRTTVGSLPLKRRDCYFLKFSFFEIFLYVCRTSHFSRCNERLYFLARVQGPSLGPCPSGASFSPRCALRPGERGGWRGSSRGG